MPLYNVADKSLLSFWRCAFSLREQKAVVLDEHLGHEIVHSFELLYGRVGEFRPPLIMDPAVEASSSSSVGFGISCSWGRKCAGVMFDEASHKSTLFGVSNWWRIAFNFSAGRASGF